MKRWTILALAGVATVAAACRGGTEGSLAECRRLVEGNPQAAAAMMDALHGAMTADSLMGERMVGWMMGQPRMRSMMLRHMAADPEMQRRMMEMMGGGMMGGGMMDPGMMGPGRPMGKPAAGDTVADRPR